MTEKERERENMRVYNFPSKNTCKESGGKQRDYKKQKEKHQNTEKGIN